MQNFLQPPTTKPLSMALAKYEIGALLGKGVTASVHQATMEQGEVRAVKVGVWGHP